MTVARWVSEIQKDKQVPMPAAPIYVGDAILGLSGFVNVILLLTTKPESGLFGQLMFQSPTGPPSTIEMDRSTGAEMEREENGYEVARLPSR